MSYTDDYVTILRNEEDAVIGAFNAVCTGARRHKLWVRPEQPIIANGQDGDHFEVTQFTVGRQLITMQCYLNGQHDGVAAFDRIELKTVYGSAAAKRALDDIESFVPHLFRYVSEAEQRCCPPGVSL